MTRMFHRFSLPVVFVIMLFIAVLPASADVSATSISFTCGSMSIVGTTASPYVLLTVIETTNSDQFNDTYPVVGGAFDITFSFTEQPAGTNFQFFVASSTDGVSPDGSIMGGMAFTCEPEKTDPPEAPATPAPAIPAPEVPEGFVMRTILCESPVYNVPAGTPVGSDSVSVGQTWYVNPVPVVAADGSSWTEIFVAGFSNPFIPTACLG